MFERHTKYRNITIISVTVFILSLCAVYFLIFDNRDSEMKVIYKGPSQETINQIRKSYTGRSQSKSETPDEDKAIDLNDNSAVAQNNETVTITEVFDIDTDKSDTSHVLLSDDSDKKVSPHGFGPYPELPDRWPSNYWSKPMTREQELIGRVRIKLYNEGKWADGITIDHGTGLVHPIYKGTIYIRWGTFTGVGGNTKRYIASAKGHPETMKSIEHLQIVGTSQLRNGLNFQNLGVSESDLPPGINFMSYEEGAIDPMEYLGLK